MAFDVTLTCFQSSNFCSFTLNILHDAGENELLCLLQSKCAFKRHVHFRYRSYLICDVDRCIQKPMPGGKISRLGRWNRSEIDDFDEGIPYRVLSILEYFKLNFPAVWKMKLLSLDLANVICTGSTFRVFVISRYNETPVILNHNNFITNCQSIRRNVDLAGTVFNQWGPRCYLLMIKRCAEIKTSSFAFTVSFTN